MVTYFLHNYRDSFKNCLRENGIIELLEERKSIKKNYQK